MNILHTGWTPSLSDEELKRNEYESVLKHVINNPDNEYWKNYFKRLVEERQLADADAVHDLLHPVDEAYQAEKQYRCENCQEGLLVDYAIFVGNIPSKCLCCFGRWQDCENCKPETKAFLYGEEDNCRHVDEMEYRKSQLPKNVIASETWLKRNTHASPAEKENARMQGEMLKKIKSKGVDFSKVSEVVKPSELNLWNQKHGDYD